MEGPFITKKENIFVLGFWLFLKATVESLCRLLEDVEVR
jgi:hypothetical protein